ncbi:hypothetical protein IW262DRAFT_1242692, partial [Armillaria fumosa]
ILSIMCDNASNNDTMIQELSRSLEVYPGERHCTHCFAHVINLIAKSMLKQFD